MAHVGQNRWFHDIDAYRVAVGVGALECLHGHHLKVALILRIEQIDKRIRDLVHLHALVPRQTAVSPGDRREALSKFIHSYFMVNSAPPVSARALVEHAEECPADSSFVSSIGRVKVAACCFVDSALQRFDEVFSGAPEGLDSNNEGARRIVVVELRELEVEVSADPDEV